MLPVKRIEDSGGLGKYMCARSVLSHPPGSSVTRSQTNDSFRARVDRELLGTVAAYRASSPKRNVNFISFHTYYFKRPYRMGDADIHFPTLAFNTGQQRGVYFGQRCRRTFFWARKWAANGSTNTHTHTCIRPQTSAWCIALL